MNRCTFVCRDFSTSVYTEAEKERIVCNFVSALSLIGCTRMVLCVHFNVLQPAACLIKLDPKSVTTHRVNIPSAAALPDDRITISLHPRHVPSTPHQGPERPDHEPFCCSGRLSVPEGQTAIQESDCEVDEVYFEVRLTQLYRT